jgi:hypothetical protein
VVQLFGLLLQASPVCLGLFTQFFLLQSLYLLRGGFIQLLGWLCDEGVQRSKEPSYFVGETASFYRSVNWKLLTDLLTAGLPEIFLQLFVGAFPLYDFDGGQLKFILNHIQLF